MRDVARRAGVSPSTVSHVINGTRSIAPATEAAVRSAIAETGYVDDQIAKSLRSRTTNTIGVATSAISNIYFTEVVSALEREAASTNRLVLLVDTHDDPAREREAVRAFVGRRVDGVVLAPSADPHTTLELLQSRGTPTVLLDRAPTEGLGFDNVRVDSVEPTAQLVDVLHRAGHRSLCMVAGIPGLTTTEERIAGVQRGVERNGMPDPLILDGGSDRDVARAALRGALRTATGRRRARPPFTAVVSGNNAMTLGILQALREEELSVPEDVSLVCFDDLPWADLLQPRLTVVAQPLLELGTTAMRLLSERIQDPSLPPRDVLLEPTLHERDSVAPPRRP
ncbi:MAG: LacI family DNA-binding transcriptional regulator [Marmoricola sp.]